MTLANVIKNFDKKGAYADKVKAILKRGIYKTWNLKVALHTTICLPN